jgi:hypothetical protein
MPVADPEAVPLGPADLTEALALLEAEPVTDCFVASRVVDSRLRPELLGGEVWGFRDGGELVALCYAGANLVPAGRIDPAAIAAFAARAARRPRRCSSIVGPVAAVEALWDRLRPIWGPARDERWDQPVLASAGPATALADPQVRVAVASDLDALLPAAVAMFTEEVGVSPLAAGGGSAYRARLSDLIARRQSLLRRDGDRVVFKAELAAVSPWASQIQGVWVDPALRGRGYGTAGMAAVVTHALAVAPTVTLYVNGHNTAARRCYEAVGFAAVGSFATILW